MVGKHPSMYKMYLQKKKSKRKNTLKMICGHFLVCISYMVDMLPVGGNSASA